MMITMLVLVATAKAESTPALSGFGAPMAATSVVNATRLLCQIAHTPEDCARLCIVTQGCIAFTSLADSCTCFGFNSSFALEPNKSAVSYFRVRPVNTTRVRPSLSLRLTVPTSGVWLGQGLLRKAFDANIRYLLQVPVNDMLFWFRRRKGDPAPRTLP